MNINLNINDIDFSSYNKIYKFLKQNNNDNNSSITVNIDCKELELLIKKYIKKVIDVDIESLGYDLNVCIEDNINIRIQYPLDDKNEYILFKNELKNILGNQIINKKDEINSKIMLRTMFINALNINICDSNLKIVYDIDNMNELENIQLQI